MLGVFHIKINDRLKFIQLKIVLIFKLKIKKETSCNHEMFSLHQQQKQKYVL